MDDQRKLIEQLMGTEILTRTSSHASGRVYAISFKSYKVCRSFLCGCCPYDLFAGSKIDMGVCPRMHSEKLRNEYEAWRAMRDIGFEFDWYDDLKKYVQECDQKMRATYMRLERSPEEVSKTNDLLKEVAVLESRLKALKSEVTQLLSNEQIVFATRLAHEQKYLEALWKFKLQLVKASCDSQNQKLQVCDVCGALLSRLDNDRRLADHFIGKLHQGYERMRKILRKLDVELQSKRRPDPEENDRHRYKHQQAYHNNRSDAMHAGRRRRF